MLVPNEAIKAARDVLAFADEILFKIQNTSRDDPQGRIVRLPDLVHLAQALTRSVIFGERRIDIAEIPGLEILREVRRAADGLVDDATWGLFEYRVDPLAVPAFQAAIRRLDEIVEALDVSRRFRGPAPEGWDYLKDIETEFRLPSSTLHRWHVKLAVEHRSIDGDSGQKIVNREAMLGIIRKYRPQP